MHSPADAAPLTRSMRGLLYAAAVLVFLAGLQLFVFPLRTEDYFAWTIDPPMTAVFLGAAYWSSVALEVVAARAPTWGRARLAVWTVFVFTTLTLVVSLVHLDRFHLGAGEPASAQAVAWGWLAVYTVVPVAMVAILVVQARAGRSSGRAPEGSRGEAAAPRPLPAGLRAVLVTLAIVLLGVGAFLLAVPAQAAAWWPWPLTELTGRAVGAWLVGLGVAAAHARLADDVAAVKPLGVTGAVFVVLQAVALARHGGDVAWSGLPAAGYLAGLLLVGLAGTWILRRRHRGA